MIDRLRIMPKSQRKLYQQAMSGESLKAAIYAFCFECCVWVNEEVFSCTDHGCPLYPYRPKPEISKDTDQNTQNYKKTKKTDQLLFNLG